MSLDLMYIFYFLSEGVHQNEKRSIWCEDVKIFIAKTEQEASGLADITRKECEICYETATGDYLCWYVRKVEMIDVKEQPLVSGDDVFTRFLTNAEAESFLNKNALE